MATTKLTSDQRKEAAAEYGWSLALINSNPEIKKVFDNAATKGYSAQRFIAEIQDTQWFKTQAAGARESMYEKAVDPKTWQAKQDTMKADLAAQAQKMGAVLTDAQLTKMAGDSRDMGWDPVQTTKALSNYVAFANSGPNKGQYIGAAGQNQQALLQTARANGYTISDDNMAKWEKSIASGQNTVGDYQQFMRRQAALTFPSFSDELLAGSDMRDVAQPYIDSMSKLLEVPQDQIDLSDPTLKKGLAQTNPQTGKPTAMSISDFENSVRQDARWQNTENAKQTAASTVLSIGRTMGVV